MDKDSSGENETSSPVDKAKAVPSLEEDKWRIIQRSLEHHRLSKMYNSQKYESELWFELPKFSNVDKDSETENNENARDDFDDEDTVNFWQNLFDEKENFESNSNVLCSSFSERSPPINNIINDLKINTSHKNLSRKPDSCLLEDILSRTLEMGLLKNDDDDDVKQDASNLRTLVPKLDLSWLEDDDDNVTGDRKNSDIEPEMKTYHITPESNSMTNHLQLFQTESDPLIGSPDMTDDVNKSHCSSPERLESDQNHLKELNENLISKANRDRTSPRKSFFMNNSSRKVSESNPLPVKNSVTASLVMTDIIKKDSKDSGFQDVTDSLETVEKAGVHGNGNQNSKLRRRSLYRRVSGLSEKKPETIEEEQPGVMELVKNGKFSSFSPKFFPKKGSTWNTIESIGPQFTQSAASKESSISFVHEQTSVATSQVSFNVSRQGDTLIKDGKAEVEQPKPVQVLPDVGHKLRALSKAEADLAEMDRWKSEMDGEKSSLKRCYCFFCGLNCGIWFC